MSNIPSFGEPTELPDWLNLPPGQLPENLAEEVGKFQEISLSAATKGMFTAEEIKNLQETADRISSPQLLEVDQGLIQQYIDSLRELQALRPEYAGKPHVKLANAWLTSSAAVYLFIMTLDIVNILSQIKQQEAKLQINLAQVKVAMAKEIANLTVLLGEVAARHCVLEAAKAYAQMGAAIAQAVCATVVTVCRERAISADHEHFHAITERYRQMSQQPEALIKGIEQGLIGGFSLGEAELKRLEASFESVRGQLQSFMDMVSKEIDALRESRSEVAKELKDFLETLLNLIRTVGEQFRQA